MTCPVCTARIDDDARFCDQCGVELFRCSRCGTVGRGPVCTKDGMPLGRYAAVAEGPAAKGEQATLLLSNTVLGVRLVVRDGDVLGRKEGRHAVALGGLASVSGRHAMVHRTAGGTWTISDLGSTNGTVVDGMPLTPGTPATIRTGTRVVIANIEFEVAG